MFEISGAAKVGPAPDADFFPRRRCDQQAIDIPARQQPIRECSYGDQWQSPFVHIRIL